jgi:uncharacterized protein (DUF1697 family)
MAQRFVALLRGINVGRAKRVPMAELRAAVEGLGFTDVRTLLNSGNVVFSGARRALDQTARALEGAVAERTGVRARVTVLTGADFSDILDANPLVELATDPSRAHVAFLREPRLAHQMLESLSAQSWEPEALAVGAHAAYLWCPHGVSGGQLAAAVDKALGDQVTMRNLATVTRLQALL